MESGQTKAYRQSVGSSSVEVDEEADVQKVISEIESSSDSDSDSSSDSGMESGRQYGNEVKTDDLRGPQMTRTMSAASLPLASEQALLPPGRKHHVFLSHSTGDQQAVKGNMVAPLRDGYGMKVVACYHCMEGKNYNDRHIEQAMTESCVVVVAISPSYLDSLRYIHVHVCMC